MAALLALPFVLLIAFALGVVEWFSVGYVSSCIWAWFLVPLGLPVVHWKTCTAVAMLAAMLRRGVSKTKAADIPWANIWISMAMPWFVLLLAWFIRN